MPQLCIIQILFEIVLFILTFAHDVLISNTDFQASRCDSL